MSGKIYSYIKKNALYGIVPMDITNIILSMHDEIINSYFNNWKRVIYILRKKLYSKLIRVCYVDRHVLFYGKCRGGYYIYDVTEYSRFGADAAVEFDYSYERSCICGNCYICPKFSLSTTGKVFRGEFKTIYGTIKDRIAFSCSCSETGAHEVLRLPVNGSITVRSGVKERRFRSVPSSFKKRRLLLPF